jgi:dihydroxyacetone kinase
MAYVLNRPEDFREDMIAGYVRAFSSTVQRIEGVSAIARASGTRPGKVAVVVGGGSGHFPAFFGLVGPGLADAGVIGDVFTSPSAEQVYRAAKYASAGAGVVLAYGNYNGDVMNFGMAARRLRAEGIAVEQVVVADDAASADADHRAERRGVAGGLFVFKVAGAAAERGDSLEDVVRLARRANASTCSFGVAFSGCTPPGRSDPLFTVRPGTMELGLGIHGERGTATVEAAPSAEIARQLVETVLADPVISTPGPKAVLVNGLGGIKYEELFVLYNDVARVLDSHGVEVSRTYIGEYVTSLEMAACSLSVMAADDELLDLLDAPSDAPFLKTLAKL